VSTGSDPARRATPGPLRVLERDLRVYRRVWRGSVFSSFLTPVLFLLAMGIGLGSLVDASTASSAAPGAGLGTGVGYLAFLAPGLLASTAMQTAAFESTFPIMDRIHWRRAYEGMLAAPLSVEDLLAGDLAFIGLRLLTVGAVFLVVMLAFGVVRSPLAILAVPGALLVGFAFSPLIVALSATQRDTTAFNALFRFGITPLFLFSGTFFPVERLPGFVQPLALVTPLYHGVALIRGLTLGSVGPEAALGHTAVLFAYVAAGLILARHFLRRRLVK
jgi:lipooligosaccharide transport system permease protein